MVHLPYEIWDIIASHCDQDTLTRTGLVSQDLRSISETKLYKSIKITRTGKERAHNVVLKSLLSTLLKRPDLRLLTRNFYIDHNIDDNEDSQSIRFEAWGSWSTASIAEVRTLCNETAELSTFFKEDKTWEHDILIESTNALLATALVLLEDLETLHLGHGAMLMQNHVGYVFNRAALPTPGHLRPLAKVTRIAYNNTRGSPDKRSERGNYFLLLTPLFRVPLIWSLDLTIHPDDGFQANTLGRTATPSLVKDLRLKFSNLIPGQLRDILMETARLKRFHCHMSKSLNLRTPRQVFADRQWHLDILNVMLQPVGNTLEEFILEMNDEVSGFQCGGPLSSYWSGSFGSLRHFVVLRTLEIPAQVLLGPWSDVDSFSEIINENILPETLESLCLTDGSCTFVSSYFGNQKLCDEGEVVSNKPLINALFSFLSSSRAMNMKTIKLKHFGISPSGASVPVVHRGWLTSSGPLIVENDDYISLIRKKAADREVNFIGYFKRRELIDYHENDIGRIMFYSVRNPEARVNIRFFSPAQLDL